MLLRILALQARSVENRQILVQATGAKLPAQIHRQACGGAAVSEALLYSLLSTLCLPASFLFERRKERGEQAPPEVLP